MVYGLVKQAGKDTTVGEAGGKGDDAKIDYDKEWGKRKALRKRFKYRG